MSIPAYSLSYQRFRMFILHSAVAKYAAATGNAVTFLFCLSIRFLVGRLPTELNKLYQPRFKEAVVLSHCIWVYLK